MIIEMKVKRWGNSLGVIIPSEAVESRGIVENQNIKVLFIRDSRKVLRETFGLLKGKINKPTQKIKDELRRDLY